LTQFDPIQLNLTQFKYLQINSIQFSQIDSNLVKLTQIQSNWLKFNQIDSNSVKLTQIQSNWLKFSQIDTSTIKLTQTPNTARPCYQIVHSYEINKKILLKNIKRKLLLIYLTVERGTSHFAYGHFAYVTFCLHIFCRQNDTLFGILCHLAYGHFAYRNRLDATKLCVKLPISIGQMIQNLFQHLSHSAYKSGCKNKNLSYVGLG
jgi:hypothetical protein